MTFPGGQEGGIGCDGTERIGFKAHLAATVVPGEAAYLVSQREVLALRGAHAEVLAPLLDGTRSVAQVVRDAAPLLSAGQTRAALASLTGAGLVRTWPAPAGAAGTAPAACTAPAAPAEGAPADSEAYWDLLGLDGGAAARDVRRATVRVVALDSTGPLEAERARAACRDSGIGLAEPGGYADFALVLCDDFLSPALKETDSVHRAQGTPWMPVRATGAEPWIGPVMRPGTGPCWSCMATRLRLHRRSERPLQLRLGLDGPLPRPASSLGAGAAAALQLAVLETAKWLAGVRSEAQSSIRILDSRELGITSHPVARLPQCAVCGDPALVARRVRSPFVPVSRPKAPHSPGADRALGAEQVLAAYGHLVGPVTGVVKAVERDPGAPDFLHAFHSGHNLALAPRSLAGLHAGLRALSGGKGLDETDARTSALCEAVERYSGTRQGDEPVVRDSYRALGAAAAVHPYACQLYDERQLRDRDRWNAAGSALSYVPEPFDERRPTEWTPVWSLTGRTHRLLPTSLLYFGDTHAPDGLCADSNGNAAGSSPEDALLQGFMELVERDAVAQWWYNRLRVPAIDLDAAGEPYVERLRAGYRSLGREVWALDLTSDFGIPVVAALSRRTSGPAEEILFGFGAHFDPRTALRRALTEMGQLLPAVAAAGPGGGHRVTDPAAVRWWSGATVANQPYLVADPACVARTPQDWGYRPRADLLEDVNVVTELVRERGMELLVLDQTRPDLRLPVVKVIVPGMRHFWPRFAPGRLYDVPVALGRCPEPTPYEELNPVAMFV
ncbi:TOMM precursor leader peptide-binding protein [Streptomyces sp. NPDC085524]|uniref:TOMM precursor leader peptide-binding protein n=1 Tax=unclassified Streptomyces TaxID=2593676 RepID=UPI0035DDA741